MRVNIWGNSRRKFEWKNEVSIVATSLDGQDQSQKPF